MTEAGLVVIVPSRGRPENIAELIQAWAATTDEAVLLVAIDDDDPRRDEYLELPGQFVIGPRLRMAGTLNAVAVEIAPQAAYVGFMGDDHRPRTKGWDTRIIRELDRLGTGFAYGNDLLQGPLLPTAVFMTADIINTLGWMAPPGLIHLFLDNSWLTLGRALGAITYLPDVVIEHVHPVAGKAEWDEGYVAVNASDVWNNDEAVFRAWRDTQLVLDVAKIWAARHG